MPLTLNPVRWDIRCSFLYTFWKFIPTQNINIHSFFNCLYCTTKMLGAHECQQDITKKSSWNTNDALECLGLVDNAIIKATRQLFVILLVTRYCTCQMTSKELNTEGPCKSNHEVKVQCILVGGKQLNDAECALPTL